MDAGRLLDHFGNFLKAKMKACGYQRLQGTKFFQMMRFSLTFFIYIIIMSSNGLYLKIEVKNASFSILNSLTLECFAQIFNFRDVFLILKLG